MWEHKVKCKLCGKERYSRYKDLCNSCYNRLLKIRRVNFKFNTLREWAMFDTGMIVGIIYLITGWVTIILTSISLPLSIIWFLGWLAFIYYFHKPLCTVYFRESMKMAIKESYRRKKK